MLRRLVAAMCLPLAVLTLLAGCGPMDPQVRATTDYLRVLQPLLIENSLLAERVLAGAAGIYNEKVDPEALASDWRTDIVPLAEHLHNQANFITPPDTWKSRHDQLIAIWGDRATAYRSLAEAIESVDADQWKAAREMADGVKLREEEWFRDVNQQLAPNGMLVDQFP